MMICCLVEWRVTHRSIHGRCSAGRRLRRPSSLLPRLCFHVNSESIHLCLTVHPIMSVAERPKLALSSSCASFLSSKLLNSQPHKAGPARMTQPTAHVPSHQTPVRPKPQTETTSVVKQIYKQPSTTPSKTFSNPFMMFTGRTPLKPIATPARQPTASECPIEGMLSVEPTCIHTQPSPEIIKPSAVASAQADQPKVSKQRKPKAAAPKSAAVSLDSASATLDVENGIKEMLLVDSPKKAPAPRRKGKKIEVTEQTVSDITAANPAEPRAALSSLIVDCTNSVSTESTIDSVEKPSIEPKSKSRRRVSVAPSQPALKIEPITVEIESSTAPIIQEKVPAKRRATRSKKSELPVACDSTGSIDVIAESTTSDVQPQFNVESTEIYEYEAIISFEPNDFAMDSVATALTVESPPLVETAVSTAPKKQKTIKPKAKSKSQLITTEAEKIAPEIHSAQPIFVEEAAYIDESAALISFDPEPFSSGVVGMDLCGTVVNTDASEPIEMAKPELPKSKTKRTNRRNSMKPPKVAEEPEEEALSVSSPLKLQQATTKDITVVSSQSNIAIEPVAEFDMDPMSCDAGVLHYEPSFDEFSYDYAASISYSPSSCKISDYELPQSVQPAEATAIHSHQPSAETPKRLATSSNHSVDYQQEAIEQLIPKLSAPSVSVRFCDQTVMGFVVDRAMTKLREPRVLASILIRSASENASAVTVSSLLHDASKLILDLHSFLEKLSQFQLEICSAQELVQHNADDMESTRTVAFATHDWSCMGTPEEGKFGSQRCSERVATALVNAIIKHQSLFVEPQSALRNQIISHYIDVLKAISEKPPRSAMHSERAVRAACRFLVSEYSHVLPGCQSSTCFDYPRSVPFLNRATDLLFSLSRFYLKVVLKKLSLSDEPQSTGAEAAIELAATVSLALQTVHTDRFVQPLLRRLAGAPSTAFQVLERMRKDQRERFEGVDAYCNAHATLTKLLDKFRFTSNVLEPELQVTDTDALCSPTAASLLSPAMRMCTAWQRLRHWTKQAARLDDMSSSLAFLYPLSDFRAFLVKMYEQRNAVASLKTVWDRVQSASMRNVLLNLRD